MILRYATAQLEEYQKADAYRYYCATALKCIADNTRAFAGGSAHERSFWDIMHPKAEPVLAPEEIISGVTAKAGLNVTD